MGFLKRQAESFQNTLDGRLASHAVQYQATGKLPVAYDIRHLCSDAVGTRTYAVALARALARIPEIELTILVRVPEQASGLSGRVVLERQWQDDVAVIHRPAQVFDPRDLELMFDSSAHVVITYQDLIGYRAPPSFADHALFERYRATSSLALQATQRVIAISRCAADEISAEFAIPRQEIAVVYHGVETAWFAERPRHDQAIRRSLSLPDRYFFSIAADFPHKNLLNLLDAYAIMRGRWRDGQPPELIIAGHTSSARTSTYALLELSALPDGLRFLGPVSADELRLLYQDALAFVSPSLYEGFGLTPLEAMAAGTPVIAMPISAVPEVVGDCVLYPRSLSAASLASAMETLARRAELRAELRSIRLQRLAQFRWESSARATFEAYKTAVLRPSERSLRSRRLLRDSILHWARTDPFPLGMSSSGAIDPILAGRSLGVRLAWRAFNSAVQSRLRRDLRRLRRARWRKRALSTGQSHA
jgi:glycosyltransferase involved in cell wall biosynthesis